MGITVSLPQLGESVDSGTIVVWLVGVGDGVTRDQAIAEVSTDKVDTEIPSPATGTVSALLVDVDELVTVGQPILELDGGAAEAAGGEAGRSESTLGRGTTTEMPAVPSPAGTQRAEDDHAAGPLSPLVKRLLRDAGLRAADLTGTGTGGRITPDDVQDAVQRERPMLSPRVKRLLRDNELTSDDILGTGRNGRITPDDVLATASSPSPALARSSGAAAPQVAAPAPAKAAAGMRPPREGDRVEELTRTRSIIAERMRASLQTTAQLTAAVEADVTRMMQVRERVNPGHKARYGTSLSPLAFVSRAVCRTLARHPVLNASIDADAGTVTYHNGVDLGIAVDAPTGLVVPAIRDADLLTVVGLQRRIADLAARARDRKLTPDDVSGGTFTITNTGSRGSLFDTPILNPPEVGILATPTIEKRPVVVTDAAGNDTIAVRQRTYLCLTYDHRLVDGADAARFLTDLAADLDDAGWDREVAELG